MDLLPYSLSSIQLIPEPIPSEYIFVTSGAMLLLSKSQLISIIHDLNLSEMTFESADELDIAMIDQIDTETIWLVRLSINHQICHGLVLGSEL
jgi:hypothetical protein